MRVLLKELLGLLGLALCLVVAWLGLNWRDEAPTLLSHQLMQTPPMPAEANNVYFFMMGFSTPVDQSPAEEGQRIVKVYRTYSDQENAGANS